MDELRERHLDAVVDAMDKAEMRAVPDMLRDAQAAFPYLQKGDIRTLVRWMIDNNRYKHLFTENAMDKKICDPEEMRLWHGSPEVRRIGETYAKSNGTIMSEPPLLHKVANELDVAHDRINQVAMELDSFCDAMRGPDPATDASGSGEGRSASSAIFRVNERLSCLDQAISRLESKLERLNSLKLV